MLQTFYIMQQAPQQTSTMSDAVPFSIGLSVVCLLLLILLWLPDLIKRQ
jgi:hypothetical protein